MNLSMFYPFIRRIIWREKTPNNTWFFELAEFIEVLKYFLNGDEIINVAFSFA